jgi:hypothetical protein
MRAQEEYIEWCGGYLPSASEEKAYTTGFNRAVELMELYLKERINENDADIS